MIAMKITKIKIKIKHRKRTSEHLKHEQRHAHCETPNNALLNNAY